MNASILFTQSESIRHEIVKLSRIECLAMVESKTCDNKKMKCDDIGCIYSELPYGEFTWYRNNEFFNFECKFHKKHIVGDNLTNSLFSNTLSSCKPDDLFCHLYDSIIVWNEASIKTIYENLLWAAFYEKRQLSFFSNRRISFSINIKF